jgi:hypothetical protein
MRPKTAFFLVRNGALASNIKQGLYLAGEAALNVGTATLKSSLLGLL